MRDGKRHQIFGCPGDHLCGSVIKFHADYSLQTKGVMGRYDHAELPAKYADMIPMYDDWLGFFTHRREDIMNGGGPETQRQIDAFRQAEAARGKR